VERGRGSHLVADVRTGKDPPAPLFELEVIWPHTETWPAALRPLGAREQIRLRDLRGYPVVLNFWASWCVPCAKEAPRLVSSARAHRGKVIFLGVDVQDFSSDARRFLRRHQVDYVSVRSRSSAVYDAYGLTGLPETYYLDRRGRIVDHYPGELSRRQLEDSIATIARAGS
jgi:cytochrome c biogenesis protein CcmG/thiol:disulfide interchange protein DsbE